MAMRTQNVRKTSQSSSVLNHRIEFEFYLSFKLDFNPDPNLNANPNPYTNPDNFLACYLTPCLRAYPAILCTNVVHIAYVLGCFTTNSLIKI